MCLNYWVKAHFNKGKSAMKTSKRSIVKALMDADKNISVKEICEKTGFSKSQVYVIRNHLKTGGKKKLTRVNKNVVAKTPSKDKLIAENDQLHRFCLEWRARSDKQESEIARLQHLYMDSKAVINYLESKIQQLFKE